MRPAIFLPEEIVERIVQNLGQGTVDLVALSYSMGDGIHQIVRLQDAPNRGLIQQDGAGLHVVEAQRSLRPLKPRAGQPSFCPAFIAVAISIPG